MSQRRRQNRASAATGAPPAPSSGRIVARGWLLSAAFWTSTARAALTALLTNKVRSLLAMLGIIIGIAAVIAMVAVGSGAEAQIMARFKAMGTNLLFVRAVSKTVNGVNVGGPTLSVDDAFAALDVPGIAAISPEALGRVQMVYRNRNMSVQTLGVAPPFFGMRNMEFRVGRPFTDDEVDRLARAVVLGAGVAHVLFEDAEPVGQTVKLNNINFRVIGVLKAMGDQGFADPDQQAMVPYSTSMKILTRPRGIWLFDVVVADGADMDAVAGQPTSTKHRGGPTLHDRPPPAQSITGVLRQRHRLWDLDKADDFVIQNQAKLVADSVSSAATFRVLLGTIASISLLVGGIGIMNIMLVSIVERTREIGVRRALGARKVHIVMQFLVETVVLTTVGGVLGAGMGIGAAKVIDLFAAMPGSTLPPPIVHWWYATLAVAISTGVGILSGVWPAWKASQLDPIVALRYE